MSSPIEIVARLLHGGRGRGRSMALLQAFFDESGTHGKQSPLVAVAGFVGTDAEWAKIEARWVEILGLYGVRELHMTDFLAQERDFALMDTPTREDLLRGLVGTLKDSGLTAISASVDASKYEEATTEQFRVVFPKPYDLCFNEVIRSVSYWSEANGGQEVGLVFASHPGHDERSYQNWRRYSHLKTIGGLQFDHPKKSPHFSVRTCL